MKTQEIDKVKGSADLYALADKLRATAEYARMCAVKSAFEEMGGKVSKELIASIVELRRKLED